jgi:hypothetical protein
MADGLIDITKPVNAGVSLPTALDQVRANFVQAATHIANSTDAHGLAAIIDLLNSVVAEVTSARGTRAGLLQRLDNALNPDGTLKASITINNGSEWVDPQLTVGKTNSSTFTVGGNHTDVYLPYRKVAVSDGTTTTYSMVLRSTYNGSTTTSVTLYDAVVMDNPTTAKYGIVTPGQTGPSSLDCRVLSMYIPNSNGGF